MKRVITFYKFCSLDGLDGLRERWLAEGQRLDLRGTLLVAAEGINGTVVGSVAALRELQEILQSTVGALTVKWSDLDAANPGFYRFKVKLKSEIVTFGVSDLDLTQTGEHVDARRFDELLADPDVVVIDTRNQYEIDIGTFEGAVNPGTTNFREFPAWVTEHLDPQQRPRVAMFCTGGIRCEKASAYLRREGFEEVYQLDGGILRYLEDTPAEDSRWQGECFVFDQRVSVDHALQQGGYEQCFACRHPISTADMRSPLYEPGVSCPHCADRKAPPEPPSEGRRQDRPDRAERLRERQRQVDLAVARGASHIGERQGG
ncbi:MAG: rhodanese-related sulfurtransferase [Pseudomonadota bacterium]